MITKKYVPKSNPEYAGAGAAGGMGFAFLTFTNAILEQEIKIVMKETGLETYIKDADIVITGENFKKLKVIPLQVYQNVIKSLLS